jgi:DNA modification methylase
MGRRQLEELLRAAREAGLSIVDMCIWAKQAPGLGSFYRSQHEPVFVFRSGKASHLNNIELGRHGRLRSNIWSFRGLSSFGRDREASLAMHPTVKPVAMIMDAIKDCTRRGDIVLDPFAGSGSTIIAAEKAKRIGYGIELEPKYVDTIVRRWEKMSGRRAVHAASGATFDDLLEGRNRGASAQQKEIAHG